MIEITTIKAKIVKNEWSVFVLVGQKSLNLYNSIQFSRLHLLYRYWREDLSRRKNHSGAPDVLCLLFLFCTSYKELPQSRGLSSSFSILSNNTLLMGKPGFSRGLDPHFYNSSLCPVPRIVFTQVTFTEMIHRVGFSSAWWGSCLSWSKERVLLAAPSLCLRMGAAEKHKLF